MSQSLAPGRSAELAEGMICSVRSGARAANSWKRCSATALEITRYMRGRSQLASAAARSAQLTNRPILGPELLDRFVDRPLAWERRRPPLREGRTDPADGLADVCSALHPASNVSCTAQRCQWA